mgnify:CR=1 FL=1
MEIEVLCSELEWEHSSSARDTTIEELQFQGRVESYIIWAVPALVKLRWYYVEYTYEGKQ